METANVLPLDRRDVERQKIQVRNRRMVRMRQLEKEGEYFSLWNMQDRAPLLYHEHVGRFEDIVEKDAAREQGGDAMEDDGESESANSSRKQCQGSVSACLTPGEWRDSNKVSKTLADLLLHTIDRKDMKTRLDLEQEKQDACAEESEEDSHDEGEQHTAMDEDGKESQRQTSPEEIERLRTEFLKIMKERFLQGLDGDYFDYGACDEDTELDDLEQIGRDAEEDYFDNDDAQVQEKPSRAELFVRFQAASVRGDDRIAPDDLDY